MSTNNETNVHPSQPAATCMRPLAVQAAEDRAAAGPPAASLLGSPAGESLAGEGPDAECLAAERPAGGPHPLFSRAVRVTGWPKRPRPPKSALMPEIASLAMEGHSGRAIGRQLGVPRRTVDRWLGELRQQWAEKVAESPEGLGGILTARLEAVYREAMQAWRRSLADKQVTLESPGDDDDAQPKHTRRTTTQSGQAALLGKAMQAAKEISKVQAQQLSQARAERAAERARESAKQNRESLEQLKASMRSGHHFGNRAKITVEG